MGAWIAVAINLVGCLALQVSGGLLAVWAGYAIGIRRP